MKVVRVCFAWEIAGLHVDHPCMDARVCRIQREASVSGTRSHSSYTRHVLELTWRKNSSFAVLFRRQMRSLRCSSSKKTCMWAYGRMFLTVPVCAALRAEKACRIGLAIDCCESLWSRYCLPLCLGKSVLTNISTSSLIVRCSLPRTWGPQRTSYFSIPKLNVHIYRRPVGSYTRVSKCGLDSVRVSS